MQTNIFFSSLAVVLLLSACDRSPTVINTPPSTVAVPVPVPVPVPGPQGAQGVPGKPGESGSTTVIVTPQAASAPK